MNKIKTMSLSFICLLNLLVISSSYAEVKSSSPEQKEILTQAELSQCRDKTKFLAQTTKQHTIACDDKQYYKK